ncbi:MAG: hypothetical protein ACREV9_10785 [Burkholderiales bacterium]
MSDGDEWRTFRSVPRRRRELIDWLKEHPSADYWHEDDWRRLCLDNFATSACALCALAREEVWPIDRWREALQAWSEDKLLNRSWRYIAPVLGGAPDGFLQALAHGVSWWLRASAKTFEAHATIFLSLCRRVLAMEHQDGMDVGEPVTRAINHPVGHVTEALLRWWYRRSLVDGQSLPEELRLIFTELCNIQIDKFRHGRVLLAAHVIALYRVDPDWATVHLLPLFDWQRSAIEVREVWEGFLWSPRLYRPLIEAIKRPFLDTAQHYESLGTHARQYAALLTFAALEPGDTFTSKELADAMRALPAHGLRDAAQALVRALEGAGDQRADYWAHRVLPYLRSVWPKSRERITPAISESLARLCVAAQDAFPEALEELRYWLQPLDHPDYAVHRLHDAKLCERFPDAALTFLDIVAADDTQWPPTHLRRCLEDSRAANPQLTADSRLQRLTEYLRRHGQA